jgi:hypothetical protein
MPTRLAARFAATALLAAVLAMAGCWYPGYRPGGPQASRDQYTYPSTVDTPQSVRLTNTVTGQTLWEVDIPIGKQLVVWFFDGQKTGDASNPSVMRWEIMNLGHESGDLDNAMPVPGPGVRRVDTFTRTSPAGGGTASREPIAEPVRPYTPADRVTGPQ